MPIIGDTISFGATSGGSNLEVRSITITENGIIVIHPSAGKDGISEITINTQVTDTNQSNP